MPGARPQSVGRVPPQGRPYGKSDEWARLLVKRYEQARHGVELAYVPPPDAYPEPVPVCQDKLLCQLLAHAPPDNSQVEPAAPRSPVLPPALIFAKSPFVYLEPLDPLDNAKYTADLALLLLLLVLVVVFVAALKSGWLALALAVPGAGMFHLAWEAQAVYGHVKGNTGERDSAPGTDGPLDRRSSGTGRD